MGRRHFCIHFDTTESSLEMKVLEQSIVERRCYSHVTHRFTNIMHTLLIRPHTWCIQMYVTHTLVYVMHTLLIRSHTLCIRYSYAQLRYAYVSHTLAFVTHALLIRMHTLCIRYSYACVRYAYVAHTLTFVMHMLLIRLHTLRIRYSYACIGYAYVHKQYTGGCRRMLGFEHSKVVHISISKNLPHAIHTFYHTL